MPHPPLALSGVEGYLPVGSPRRYRSHPVHPDSGRERSEGSAVSRLFPAVILRRSDQDRRRISTDRSAPPLYSRKLRGRTIYQWLKSAGRVADPLRAEAVGAPSFLRRVQKGWGFRPQSISPSSASPSPSPQDCHPEDRSDEGSAFPPRTKPPCKSLAHPNHLASGEWGAACWFPLSF